MLNDLIGTYGSRLLVAVAGVGLALLCLVFILRFIKSRGPSPFLRGGRAREPRLQVLDAAAVDTRRRLVLVRRDNVEHLIMIGGPTDVVIESRIMPHEDAGSPARYEPLPDAGQRSSYISDKRAYGETYSRDEDDDADEEIDNDPYDDVDDVTPPPPPVKIAPRATVIQPALRDGPASEWRSRAAAAESASAAQANRQRELPLDPSPVVQTPAVAREMPVPSRAAPADAADILDAARNRVLARAEPARPAPVVRTVNPREAGPRETSDFDRFLEAEMASTLDAARKGAVAREGASARPAAAPATPARPIVATPPARSISPAATAQSADREQRAIQREAARIFGDIDSGPRKP